MKSALNWLQRRLRWSLPAPARFLDRARCRKPFGPRARPGWPGLPMLRPPGDNPSSLRSDRMWTGVTISPQTRRTQNKSGHPLRHAAPAHGSPHAARHLGQVHRRLSCACLPRTGPTLHLALDEIRGQGASVSSRRGSSPECRSGARWAAALVTARGDNPGHVVVTGDVQVRSQMSPSSTVAKTSPARQALSKALLLGSVQHHTGFETSSTA